MNDSRARLIMHVDMDAFYASIEQLDNAEFRGKPVIVGADPCNGRGRGVVSAASYEARKYGIHSAMPISLAYRKCPHGVFVPVRGHRYMEISRMIMSIFFRHTPHVEPISLDEAFLDLTGTERLSGPVIEQGQAIKQAIFAEVGLRASVGIGPCKLIAKIASDLEKPDGFVSVPHDGVIDFLSPLPVRRLWGIGKKTEAQLAKLGIHSIGELQKIDQNILINMLGQHGQHLYNLSRGIDTSPVLSHRAAKSVSNEITFSEDTDNRVLIHETIVSLADKVAHRLQKHGIAGRTVTIKVRFQDFNTRIRHKTLSNATNLAQVIRDEALPMVFNELGQLPVRLLGVGVTQLTEDESLQTGLFDNNRDSEDRAARAVAELRQKYGFKSIQLGAITRKPIAGGGSFEKP